LLPAGEFTIADLFTFSRVANVAILRSQLCTFYMPVLCGHFKQQLAGAGCDLPELASHLRRSPAAESAHVKRRKLSVSHNQRHRGRGSLSSPATSRRK